MANFIQNIELPKDDSRCAHILRTVINNLKEKENESRSASSSERYANQVYALRQKMFGSYRPPSTRTDSRSASSVGVFESTERIIRNKAFELRRVMFGSYS